MVLLTWCSLLPWCSLTLVLSVLSPWCCQCCQCCHLGGVASVVLPQWCCLGGVASVCFRLGGVACCSYLVLSPGALMVLSPGALTGALTWCSHLVLSSPSALITWCSHLVLSPALEFSLSVIFLGIFLLKVGIRAYNFECVCILELIGS